MLHRWSSASNQSVAVAPTTMASTTFSLFFPMPKQAQWPEAADDAACDDHSSITTSPSSPSSSSTGSVDCTLSLGTPSSRRAAEPPELTKRLAQPAYPSASPATVSWDAAAETPPYYCQGSKPAGGAAKGAMACAGHDPLLMDRRCTNCGTSSTPLWRNGPRGPKSLCNACGIRFKKEERRAATAAMEGGAAGCGYSARRAQYGPSAAKAPHGAVSSSYGEGAFPYGGDADTDAPFLAWRLNVVAPAPAFQVWPERTSLFQYN